MGFCEGPRDVQNAARAAEMSVTNISFCLSNTICSHITFQEYSRVNKRL